MKNPKRLESCLGNATQKQLQVELITLSSRKHGRPNANRTEPDNTEEPHQNTCWNWHVKNGSQERPKEPHNECEVSSWCFGQIQGIKLFPRVLWGQGGHKCQTGSGGIWTHTSARVETKSGDLDYVVTWPVLPLFTAHYPWRAEALQRWYCDRKMMKNLWKTLVLAICIIPFAEDYFDPSNFGFWAGYGLGKTHSYYRSMVGVVQYGETKIAWVPHESWIWRLVPSSSAIGHNAKLLPHITVT